MWGIASDNEYLAGLGKLQVAVVSRSINEYFLLKDDNTNHPADFVKNKVSRTTRPAAAILSRNIFQNQKWVIFFCYTHPARVRSPSRANVTINPSREDVHQVTKMESVLSYLSPVDVGVAPSTDPRRCDARQFGRA